MRTGRSNQACVIFIDNLGPMAAYRPPARTWTGAKKHGKDHVSGNSQEKPHGGRALAVDYRWNNQGKYPIASLQPCRRCSGHASGCATCSLGLTSLMWKSIFDGGTSSARCSGGCRCELRYGTYKTVQAVHDVQYTKLRPPSLALQ